ncbi:MAG: DnaJ domain-containing protein [Desulfoferrobacter sp.]
MVTCYYKILGISFSASQEEIKRAFRLLAFRCHPDRNPDDPRAGEHFRRALEAYETLVDPIKRKKYDRLKGYVERGNGTRERSRTSSQACATSLKDALKEAFGIQYGLRERVVSDLRFDLLIPSSALLEGTYEWIDYARLVFCCECMGNGRKSTSYSCEKCHGNGEFEETCSLRVWIPPGTMPGSRLRISGVGDHPRPGSRAGDLVILLHTADRM